MLKFECILVYHKYWTLNLLPLMVYPKVLLGVDIQLHIQCLASGSESPLAGSPPRTVTGWQRRHAACQDSVLASAAAQVCCGWW